MTTETQPVDAQAPAPAPSPKAAALKAAKAKAAKGDKPTTPRPRNTKGVAKPRSNESLIRRLIPADVLAKETIEALSKAGDVSRKSIKSHIVRTYVDAVQAAIAGVTLSPSTIAIEMNIARLDKLGVDTTALRAQLAAVSGSTIVPAVSAGTASQPIEFAE